MVSHALLITNTDADPKAQSHRRQPSVLSPPPSPPTRLANLPESLLQPPRTPTRPSSSDWHDTDWELVPDYNHTAEIRTSDSRLIKAKRESDQALAICRNRIASLQAECTKGREDGRLLETARSDLTEEVQKHKAQIAELEQSRASVTETLSTTQTQLDALIASEEVLKQELQANKERIATLEQSNA